MPRNQLEIPVSEKPLSSLERFQQLKEVYDYEKKILEALINQKKAISIPASDTEGRVISLSEKSSLLSLSEMVDKNGNLNRSKHYSTAIRLTREIINAQIVKYNHTWQQTVETQLKYIEEEREKYPENTQLLDDANHIRKNLQDKKEQLELEGEWQILRRHIKYLEKELENTGDLSDPDQLYYAKSQLLKIEIQLFFIKLKSQQRIENDFKKFDLKELKLKVECLESQIKIAINQQANDVRKILEKILIDTLYQFIPEKGELLEKLELSYQKEPSLEVRKKFIKTLLRALQLEEKFSDSEKKLILAKSLQELLPEIIKIDEELLTAVEVCYQKEPTQKKENRLNYLKEEIGNFSIQYLRLKKQEIEKEIENINILLKKVNSKDLLKIKEKITTLYESLLDKQNREEEIMNQILDLKILTYFRKLDNENSKEEVYNIQKKLTSTQCFKEKYNIIFEKQKNLIKFIFLETKFNFIEINSSREYLINKNELLKIKWENSKIIPLKFALVDRKEKLENFKIEGKFGYIENCEIALNKLSQLFDFMDLYSKQFMDDESYFFKKYIETKLDSSEQDEIANDDVIIQNLIYKFGDLENEMTRAFFQFDIIYNPYGNALRNRNAPAH